MSASNEKKRRQAEREQGTDVRENTRREAAKSRRRSRIVWTLVIIVLVLLVAVMSVLNSDLMYRLPAARVGGTTYSGAEMRYYYMDTYRSLEAYGLVDPKTPVDEQECPELEEEGGTWHDYIMQSVEQSLIQIQALIDEAEAAGYTMSEEAQSSVASTMDYYRSAAEQSSVSLKEFISFYYGDGVTPKLVEKLVTRAALANDYQQHVRDGFTYTDEELTAYFDEHIDDFKTYDFMYYFIADSAIPEPPETPEEGEEDAESPDDTENPGDAEGPDDAEAPGDADEPEETAAPEDGENTGDAENPESDETESSPYYLDDSGEPVTGPDGEPIELRYLEDGNGEQVLDENGQPIVLELVYGDDGELALDDEGNPRFQQPYSSLTDAQRFANLIANYATNEETFIDAVDAFKPGDKPGLAEGVLRANLPIDWLADEEREYGDMSIATGTNENDETGCYVLMFVSSDDQHYPEVSARHILVATADEDEDGQYSDEERMNALKKMDEIRKEWNSGEQSEIRFAALAEQYSEDTGSKDNGGLYEGIYKGQMVKEFNDFCFAEGRESGDTTVVHGETSNYDGYHMIYYVGQGSQHSDELARDAMFTADYNAWSESLVEGYTVSYDWGKRYMNPGV